MPAYVHFNFLSIPLGAPRSLRPLSSQNRPGHRFPVSAKTRLINFLVSSPNPSPPACVRLRGKRQDRPDPARRDVDNL